MHTNTFLVLQDVNHYLLSIAREWSSKRCHPPLWIRKSICFCAWRWKDNYCLVSLGKSILIRVIFVQRGQNHPHVRLQLLTRLKTFVGSLTARIGAIGLLTGEIDIFLDSRANLIPKSTFMGSSRYSESFSLSIILYNNPLYLALH